MANKRTRFNVSLSKCVDILRESKAELLQRYSIDSIGVFGSIVRNQQTRRSDIDLLVHFRDLPSLLELAHIEMYLSKKLGARVDMVVENSISQQFMASISGEIVQV